MFGKLSLLGAIAALAIGSCANAQNDNCSGATAVGVGATPFSNAGATTDANPSCVLSGRDIWYVFTAPGAADYQIDTCGSGFDTTLTIFDACGGNVIACNDDSSTCGGSGLQSNVTVTNVAAGQLLIIRVAGYNNATGSGTLNVSVVGHPNEDCAHALPAGLGANGFTNIAAATDETPGCVFSGRDIWYYFVAPGIGNYQFDTCGANFDTTLTVYNSCGGAVLACNDDNATCGGSGLQSNLTVNNVAAGQVLLVRVAGYNSAAGIGSLNISIAGRPNENCSGSVPVGLGSTLWNNIGTATEVQPNCITSSSDVWYSFTAPNSGAYIFDTCGSTFDTTITIYSGCGGNVLACNDDACGLQSSVQLNSIAGGSTVIIRLAGYSNRQGTGVLHVSRAVPNDYCADATPISTGSINGSLNLATGDGSASCGSSNGNPDIWYSFTAPSCGGTLMVNTCGSSAAFGIDTVLAVFDSCGGTQLACNDDSPSGFRNCTPGAGNLDSSVGVPMSPGQTVRIRVSRFFNNTGVDFTLNVGFDYVNEDCGNATPITVGTTNWSNCLATTDGPSEANCGFCCGDAQVNNDVWFRLHVATYGIITVSTQGANFDTKLAAYSGNCPAAANTAIACNDDYFGTQSYMEFGAAGNSDYLIRAGGFSTARGSGPLTVHYYCYADFNRDDVVDFFDYLDFVQAFAGNAANSDFNHDGVIDFFDYLDFVGAFAAGC